MKNICKFILEKISDQFNIKYDPKKYFRSNSLNITGDSAWKAYQNALISYNVNSNSFNDLFSIKDAKDFSDNKFIELYKKYFYQREDGVLSSNDTQAIVVAHYCWLKYNKKIVIAKSVGDQQEHHYIISYIDGDSTRGKNIFKDYCDINCAFNTGDSGWYGKPSNIIWTGDIDNDDDFARMVLKYIKKCFE